METLVTLHPGLAALVIFTLRIIDVSLGTLRTISVVQGRVKLSVLLGFFETFVWLTAVAQALMGIEKNPLLMLAYCAGFAAGNAVGIQIERKIAMGIVVIRMFSSQAGGAIASALSLAGWHPTTFQGIGAEGPNTMIMVTRLWPLKPKKIQTIFEREFAYPVAFPTAPISRQSQGLPRRVSAPLHRRHQRERSVARQQSILLALGPTCGR
jgi:uncharacterized protein YebE (UPF0316 family)